MPEAAASVIRLAKLKDAAVIARMSRDLIEEGLPWRWRTARVARHVRDRDTIVIVAESHGELLGFAILGVASDTAHLNLLAVSRGARRQGVASTLLDWLMASCGVAGLSSITLEVRSRNQGAIRFYERHGFVSSGTRRGYYEGIEDATVMACQLIDPQTEARRPR